MAMATRAFCPPPDAAADAPCPPVNILSACMAAAAPMLPELACGGLLVPTAAEEGVVRLDEVLLVNAALRVLAALDHGEGVPEEVGVSRVAGVLGGELGGLVEVVVLVHFGISARSLGGC